MQDRKLYLKIEQNVEVCNSRVFLQDVGKLYSTDKKMVHELNKTEVLVIKSKENAKYMFSILKIIEIIHKKYPDAEVINLGEKDFVLSYVIPGKKRAWWEYCKAAPADSGSAYLQPCLKIS